MPMIQLTYILPIIGQRTGFNNEKNLPVYSAIKGPICQKGQTFQTKKKKRRPDIDL